MARFNRWTTRNWASGKSRLRRKTDSPENSTERVLPEWRRRAIWTSLYQLAGGRSPSRSRAVRGSRSAAQRSTARARSGRRRLRGMAHRPGVSPRAWTSCMAAGRSPTTKTGRSTRAAAGAGVVFMTEGSAGRLIIDWPVPVGSLKPDVPWGNPSFRAPSACYQAARRAAGRAGRPRRRAGGSVTYLIAPSLALGSVVHHQRCTIQPSGFLQCSSQFLTSEPRVGGGARRVRTGAG